MAYSAFLLSIMSPGPNILAVIGTAMSVGRRPGTALALGVGTGSVCWAVMTVAGLSALLATYAAALTVIKIAGDRVLVGAAAQFAEGQDFASLVTKPAHDEHQHELPGGLFDGTIGGQPAKGTITFDKPTEPPETPAPDTVLTTGTR